MPVPIKGEIVLLTGASGFIAGYTILQLLKDGYKVRGTVRSAEKGERLKQLITDENFSYVVVENIQDPDSFTLPLKGVTSILHLASPVSASSDDVFEGFINPAVNGTLAVFKAAAENKDIKRIVLMSSIVSAADISIDVKHTYGVIDKDSWNTAAQELYTKSKEKIDATNAYQVSKYAAERAAWDFMKAKSVSFDICVICPVLVYGLPLGLASLDNVPISTSFLVKKALGTSTPMDDFMINILEGATVDVKDVAYLTSKALRTPAAAGNRFLAVSSVAPFQDLLDVLQYPKHKSLRAKFPNFEEGKPFLGQPTARRFDISNVVKILEWDPIPVEETVVSILEGLINLSV